MFISEINLQVLLQAVLSETTNIRNDYLILTYLLILGFEFGINKQDKYKYDLILIKEM